MPNLKNNRGMFNIVLSVGVLIVIAVIIFLLLSSVFGILFFIKNNSLMIVGIFLLVFAFIGSMKNWNKKLLLFLSIVGIIFILISALGFQNTFLGTGNTQYIYDNGEVITGTTTTYGILNLVPSEKQNIFSLEKNIYTPGETIKATIGIPSTFSGKSIEYYKVCYIGASSKCYDFTSLVKSSSNPLSVKVTLSAPSTLGNYKLCDKVKYVDKSEMDLCVGDLKEFEVKKTITTCPSGDSEILGVYKWYEVTINNQIEKGYCDRKLSWEFSSPPVCTKTTTYYYKMSCPVGSIIENKETNVESWQTKGCSKCVVTVESDNTLTSCMSDVVLDCGDGHSIIQQQCVNGELINTAEECNIITEEQSDDTTNQDVVDIVDDNLNTNIKQEVKDNKNIFYFILLSLVGIVSGLIIIKILKNKRK